MDALTTLAVPSTFIANIRAFLRGDHMKQFPHNDIPAEHFAMLLPEKQYQEYRLLSIQPSLDFLYPAIRLLYKAFTNLPCVG